MIGATDAAEDANNGGIFTYATDGATAALASEVNARGHRILFLTTEPKAEADGGDAALINSTSGKKIYACVNLDTGEINIDRTFRSSRADSKSTGIICQ